MASGRESATAAPMRSPPVAKRRPLRGCARRELTGAQVRCRECTLFALCLPVGVGKADLALLERVIRRRRVLRRGEHAFRAGERFQSVYAVKSGSLKTYLWVEPEGARVTGFQLPGELVGLEAIGAAVYPYSAVALETSSLCEVPFDRLEELGLLVPSVPRQLLRILSEQTRQDLRLQVLHGKKAAEARLAAFLAGISARIARRGFAARSFRLPMSRSDLGNHLGLAKETVSRLFGRFEGRGLLSVSGKQVDIHDLAALQRLGGLRPGANER